MASHICCKFYLQFYQFNREKNECLSGLYLWIVLVWFSFQRFVVQQFAGTCPCSDCHITKEVENRLMECKCSYLCECEVEYVFAYVWWLLSDYLMSITVTLTTAHFISLLLFFVLLQNAKYHTKIFMWLWVYYCYCFF